MINLLINKHFVVQYRCEILPIVCILTRPTVLSKYSTTRKNTQRYHTTKRLRYIFLRPKSLPLKYTSGSETSSKHSFRISSLFRYVLILLAKRKFSHHAMPTQSPLQPLGLSHKASLYQWGEVLCDDPDNSCEGN